MRLKHTEKKINELSKALALDLSEYIKEEIAAQINAATPDVETIIDKVNSAISRLSIHDKHEEEKEKP